LTDLDVLALCRLLVHKSQRIEVDEDDEFYSQDLIGLTVLLYPYHAAAQPSATTSDDGDVASFSATETETQSEGESDESSEGTDAPSPEPVHSLASGIQSNEAASAAPSSGTRAAGGIGNYAQQDSRTQQRDSNVAKVEDNQRDQTGVESALLHNVSAGRCPLLHFAHAARM
jgi:hypothetical protein